MEISDRLRLRGRLYRIAAIVVLIAGSALAQSTTGTATMTGVVTDSSGAIIPGASVIVTNTDAGFVFNSVTTNEGSWYIPNLNPGAYSSRSRRKASRAMYRTASFSGLENNLASTLNSKSAMSLNPSR